MKIDVEALKRFVELAVGGMRRVDAYCQVTGKPKGKGAMEAASRWWRHPKAVEHAARLKGVLPMNSTRQDFIEWLLAGLQLSPLQLAAQIYVGQELTPEELSHVKRLKASRNCIEVVIDKAGKAALLAKLLAPVAKCR